MGVRTSRERLTNLMLVIVGVLAFSYVVVGINGRADDAAIAAEVVAQADCPPSPSPTPPEGSTTTVVSSVSPTATPPGPSATASNTPTITPSATPSNTPTITPSATPSNTPTITPSATPSNTPTETPTASPSATPTETPTPSPSPTATNTPTATPTFTPNGARQASFTVRAAATPCVTATPGDTTTTSVASTTTSTVAVSGISASVELPSVRRGAVQTGVGRGFVPGESVVGEQHSAPLGLGTQVADADGVVRFTWTIRGSETLGSHDFVVTGDQSGTATAAFTVVASDALPATGGSTSLITWWAVLAVGLGGALVVLGIQWRTQHKRS